MIKKVKFLLAFHLFPLSAQVGINTDKPHASAALEINSAQKGFLLPRLSSQAIETLSSTASEGLVVYDSDKKIFVGFNGTTWLNLSYAENNSPPYFSILPNISSSNTQQISAVLTANYSLNDNEVIDQSGLSAKYRWLKADNSNGLSASVVSLANVASYSSSLADKNKYLQVCVLPIANTGASPGLEKCSAWFGPMLEFAASTSVLASWEFTGLTGYGPSPMAASNADAQITVDGLQRANGLKTTGTTAAANAWGGNAWDQASLADAILNNDFISFAFKPNVGKIASFYKISAYNLRRSVTGASLAQWQYSLDGLNYANIGSELVLGNSTATGNNMAEINLSNIQALQNIDNSKTLTFRLAAYGGTGGTFYFNNLSGNDLEIIGQVQ